VKFNWATRHTCSRIRQNSEASDCHPNSNESCLYKTFKHLCETSPILNDKRLNTRVVSIATQFGTIWRGIRSLDTLAIAYRAFGPDTIHTQNTYRLQRGQRPGLTCQGPLGRIAVLERQTHGLTPPESAISMSRTSFRALHFAQKHVTCP